MSAARTGTTCGEPGRSMFMEHVGRYFAVEPRLRPLPAGTACSLCGSTEARTWLTDSKQASCLAQQTITRKRRNRASADEPALPVPDMAGMGCFGKGSVVVAGPHVARARTKLLPEVAPPASLELAFADKGGVNAELVSLLVDMPRPPFVAAVFGENAAFPMRVTHDLSLLHVNGPDPMVVDTERLAALRALSQRLGAKRFKELVDLRQRLAGPARGTRGRDEDQAAYAEAVSTGLLTPAELRGLPPPSADEVRLLKKING